jgi:hypothetical protein
MHEAWNTCPHGPELAATADARDRCEARDIMRHMDTGPPPRHTQTFAQHTQEPTQTRTHTHTHTHAHTHTHESHTHETHTHTHTHTRPAENALTEAVAGHEARAANGAARAAVLRRAHVPHESDVVARARAALLQHVAKLHHHPPVILHRSHCLWAGTRKRISDSAAHSRLHPHMHARKHARAHKHNYPYTRTRSPRSRRPDMRHRGRSRRSSATGTQALRAPLHTHTNTHTHTHVSCG